MVWRDIDVTVLCSALDIEAVFGLGARLVTHPRVRQAHFRNDTGRWKQDPNCPDGLYWGVEYRTAAGDDWKLDVWFIIDGTRQPDLDHIETLPPRLTGEARLAILQIKDVWHRLPAYRSTVRSYDIYEAVLDHGVRTPEQFREYLRSRRHPAGE